MKELAARAKAPDPMTEKLAKEILRHRKLYNDGKPIISDKEFDKLEEQLRKLDKNHPALNRLQSPVDKGDHKLPVPLPSLDKIRPDTGADKWLSSHDGPFVVSDKLDGLAAEIEYKVNKPTRVYSSGDDGLHGKDISHLLPYMNVPATLKKGMIVRVELIMSRADFQKHWSAKYKNPRNLATGIKNKTTGVHEAARHYKAVGLAVLEPRMKPSVALKQLAALGFHVVPHVVMPKLTVAKLSEMFGKRRKSSPYEIDGLVIEQDKTTKAPRDNPDHQVAFKDILGIDSVKVTVKKVTWEESRYGKLTPRVWFDPVRLSGVDVQKATGHNALFIWENHIAPGAVVEIVRSGDVIPKIQSVVKGARDWSPPPGKEGKDWDWSESEVDIFVHKQLKASDEQRIRGLVHFFTTIGADGYRAGTARILYDAGWDTIQKVMKGAFHDEFEEVLGEKIGAKVALGIYNACAGHEHTLAYAWSGFGRGVGSKTAAQLWQHFGEKTMRAYAKNTRAAQIAFQSVVGPVAAKAVAENLPDFYAFVDSVVKEGFELEVYKKPKVTLKSKKLSGQVICMTGFRDADLTSDIEENGGTVVDSMTNVTILLVKDTSSSSTKAQKARAKGIPIMTAMGFRAKYKL